jgi:hypothetical protein
MRQGGAVELGGRLIEQASTLVERFRKRQEGRPTDV